MNTGWICPICGASVAPTEKTCPKCTKNVYYTATINTNSSVTDENCCGTHEQMICS